MVDRFCAVGKRNAIFYRWRPSLSDPDDEFLLELAVRCRCNYLVTFNQRDFLAARMFGIRVVTPREFLTIMEL